MKNLRSNFKVMRGKIQRKSKINQHKVYNLNLIVLFYTLVGL